MRSGEMPDQTLMMSLLNAHRIELQKPPIHAVDVFREGVNRSFSVVGLQNDARIVGETGARQKHLGVKAALFGGPRVQSEWKETNIILGGPVRLCGKDKPIRLHLAQPFRKPSPGKKQVGVSICRVDTLPVWFDGLKILEVIDDVDMHRFYRRQIFPAPHPLFHVRG